MSKNKPQRSPEELFGGPLPNLDLPVFSEEQDQEQVTDSVIAVVERPIRLRAIGDFSFAMHGVTMPSCKEGDVISNPTHVQFLLNNPGYPVEILDEDYHSCPYCKKAFK